MVEFMRAGGVPMWFVLLFGVLALIAAGFFAWRPEPRKIDAIKALSIATVFSIASAIVSDIAAVGSKVPANPEWAHSPDLPLIVMQGVSESMAPGILGFSILSLVWLVMSVGHRRLGRQLA